LFLGSWLVFWGEIYRVPVEFIATPADPAMPKNPCSATDKISFNDPDRDLGSRLTRVNPCVGFRLRRDGIANRTTVEPTADKSAGAERNALPRWALIALWNSTPGSNPMWATKDDG
jgi:hypothetical protein